VHGGEDYFTRLGTFPNLNTSEFPISDESTRYFKSGRPFLQRYLPFWLGSFIERRLLILLPFMALLLGLLQALPRMMEARYKNRLVVWYQEIKALEDEIWRNGEPTMNRWRNGATRSRTSMRTPARYGCRSATSRMSTPSSRRSASSETGFPRQPRR